MIGQMDEDTSLRLHDILRQREYEKENGWFVKMDERDYRSLAEIVFTVACDVWSEVRRSAYALVGVDVRKKSSAEEMLEELREDIEKATGYSV